MRGWSQWPGHYNIKVIESEMWLYKWMIWQWNGKVDIYIFIHADRQRDAVNKYIYTCTQSKRCPICRANHSHMKKHRGERGVSIIHAVYTQWPERKGKKRDGEGQKMATNKDRENNPTQITVQLITQASEKSRWKNKQLTGCDCDRFLNVLYVHNIITLI